MRWCPLFKVMKKDETYLDNGHDFYALMLMLRWATSPWLRVVTSKRMETVARKALVEALCISLSLLRWPIQMFWKLKVDADLESNVEDANICSCTAYVYGYTKHLSFTFDVVNILMSWCCSCWPLVERVTLAQQCISVLYPIKFPGQVRDQVCENIPMRKNREILEYLKWDLVSKIHFPIFDAVVSFFWKNEILLG